MARRARELTDTQWEAIAPLLPPPNRMGRPRRDDRQVVEGILWRMRTGAPWRDVPERYGPHGTVFHRFNQWSRQGVWASVLAELNGQLREQGALDETWYVDQTLIRATQASAGGRKKGARTSRSTTRSARARGA
jgi:transposase